MRTHWPKWLLLLLYLGLDHHAIIERLGMLGFSPMLGVWFCLYGALVAALVAAALIPDTIVRVAVGLLFASASMLLHGYEWTTHTPFDYNAFETMLASSGDMREAITQYPDILLKTLFASLLLLVAIALPPKGFSLPFKLHVWLPVLVVLGMAGMLYARGGEGGRALPAPFAPLAFAAIKTALTVVEPSQERQPVAFQRPATEASGDIILIVDESVAANYLDINHPDGVHSGLATAREGLAVMNYGIAAAITNCSVGSNKSLRFGGARQNYRLAGKVHPSVWAHARAAGYRTVYLDGQRNHGQLQNLATAEEKAEIDDFVQLDGVPAVDRDQRLAQLLAERLTNGRPEFIYVNKIGAHFPVADKFPDSMAKFRPLPKRGGSVNVIDSEAIHGMQDGSVTEWRLHRNAYRNTLMWNVGAFFDRLLPDAARSNAVIIYTSDHGQDLHERGTPGKGTHCSSDPVPEEGAVPLVVIDDATQPRLDWGKELAARKNAASHFNIFPTLLALMGYHQAEVSKLYGPSLVDPGKDDMTFTNNYFAALGREPTWRRIDPGKLAAPPRSDFTSALDEQAESAGMRE